MQETYGQHNNLPLLCWCSTLKNTDIKKLIFAIGMMAVVGIASAAEASVRGDDDPAYGCVVTCKGTKCGPEYVDVEKALEEIDRAESECNERQQAPPEMR